MYPAKFSFDVTAAPSCANDFVVFPIAANGSATQPNIVAFNNLYSGTAGAAGICNRTATSSDTGVAATVYWSYNVDSIGGAVTTSPVLSYDSTGATTGAKVAFVESSANGAHFHVLAWKANDGQSASNPSIDASWGSGGSVQVCNGKLTGPTVDFVTFNVYVGCSDGKLYELSPQGTVLTSIAVGNGSTYGGIVDAPEVDGIDGFVYAVSGSGAAFTGGANGALVQAKTDLSSSVAVPIGTGGQCNIHSGTPNNTFFTSPTAAGALLYVAGVVGTVAEPCSPSSETANTNVELYGVTFGTSGVINSGTPAHNFSGGTSAGGYEWAPLLEFYNPATSTDWLFVSAL